MDPNLPNSLSTPGCPCPSLSAKMILCIPESACDTDFPRRLFLCCSWKLPSSLLVPSLYVSTSSCVAMMHTAHDHDCDASQRQGHREVKKQASGFTKQAWSVLGKYFLPEWV